MTDVVGNPEVCVVDKLTERRIAEYQFQRNSRRKTCFGLLSRIENHAASDWGPCRLSEADPPYGLSGMHSILE